MYGTKLYTCFETRNDQGQHEYRIFSAKVRKLVDMAADSKSIFSLEKVISGFPNMGCGVFGSKIVLAGGVWGKKKERSYNLKFITYDTLTKKISRKDLPPLRGRKFRPLVFELYGRLYVLDTSKSLYPWSFEIYYPTRKFWHPLSDPFQNMFTEAIGMKEGIGKKEISGRAPYFWFVVGKVLCISVPTDSTLFFHHARQFVKAFLAKCCQSLPFHGMAITHCQPGFDDVVVISFSKGCVEGRQLNFCFPDIKVFGKPKPLFHTDPYEQPDGELSGYFAEFGDGMFCLTTFDNMNMHVYMFKIDRKPERGDGLNLVLVYLVKHKFSFNDFSFEGSKGVNIPGCFVLPRDDQTKRFEEAKLYYDRFTVYEDEREGVDVPMCYKTRDGSIRSRTNLETDNRKTDSSDCESYLDADSSNSNVRLGRVPSVENPPARTQEQECMTCDL